MNLVVVFARVILFVYVVDPRLHGCMCFCGLRGCWLILSRVVRSCCVCSEFL